MSPPRRGPNIGTRLAKTGKGCPRGWDSLHSQGRRVLSVTFAFRRLACHVNALDFSSFFSLLDHGSDIKELRMCWQPLAAINSLVVRCCVVSHRNPFSMSPRSQGTIDEETPLLHGENSPRKPTPLPVTQISVLLLLLLAEPITSLSINPYINQV